MEPLTGAPQRFMISHLDEADFRIGGLRDYSAYRDLGIAQATCGLAEAHVIRMIALSGPSWACDIITTSNSRWSIA